MTPPGDAQILVPKYGEIPFSASAIGVIYELIHPRFCEFSGYWASVMPGLSKISPPLSYGAIATPVSI